MIKELATGQTVEREDWIFPDMTPEAKAWQEKALRITAAVPFVCDWVEYKGRIVFAEIDFEKSVAAGRPIIGIGYCATAVIVNRRIDSTHNYSPETFKRCRHSEKWK
jgi:hypothetical protein